VKKEADIENLFKEAFDNYFEQIVRFIYYYCKDWEESKNIAQDTFVALWQNMEKVDWTRPLIPYLLLIAKNKTLNVMKGNMVRRKHDDYLIYRDLSATVDALSSGTLNKIYSNEMQQLISKSLEQMTESVRTTFVLSRYNNLKNKEVAELLNISIKTVEYRIMSALRILKNNLKEFI